MGGENEHVIKSDSDEIEDAHVCEENDDKLEFLESSADFEERVNCCHDKSLLAKTIFSGQVLSVMLCSTGTAATALSTLHNIRIPAFNAFTMYVLLASTFGVYTVRGSNFIPLMKRHWWKYLVVTILDVEANYLLTKAYSYTTLTSVQLCDSFTIPTVMVISFIFLRVRYKIIHYVGVILCISGAVSLVLIDNKDKKDNASNEILGDVIALCAAVLYGTSQVGQEYLVKKYSWKEYLGMVGLYGSIISGLQTILLERDAVRDAQWNWQNSLIIMAFAVCQFVYYAVMPYVMLLSSATVVNLSLLTSDLYTLIVGLFVFGYHFSYLYFIAFAGIITGLITYNIRPVPTAQPRKKKNQAYIEAGKDTVTVSNFKDERWYQILFKKDASKTPLLKQNNNIAYTQL